jgi:hypothetical protein
MASNTKAQKFWNWLNRRNYTDLIAVLALLISLISLLIQISPPAPRAKFTVFANNPSIGINPFWTNLTEIDVTGWIVNEGALAGQITRFDLFIDLNESYSYVFSKFDVPTGILLSPTEKANFTMQKNLIGVNDMRLPENAIRNCTIWFEYKDANGLQTTEQQITYLQ